MHLTKKTGCSHCIVRRGERAVTAVTLCCIEKNNWQKAAEPHTHQLVMVLTGLPQDINLVPHLRQLLRPHDLRFWM